MYYETIKDALQAENLCTHFILPLLKLNKYSFIASNFVNSYLTRNKRYIAVRVIDLNLIYMPNIFAHSQFRGSSPFKDDFLIWFEIPDKWKTDVSLFCEGKFSKLSEKAKDTIITFSELSYNKLVAENESPVTDFRLLALEKHESLKAYWKDILYGESTGLDKWYRRDREDEELLNNVELLPIPSTGTYIDLK